MVSYRHVLDPIVLVTAPSGVKKVNECGIDPFSFELIVHVCFVMSIVSYPKAVMHAKHAIKIDAYIFILLKHNVCIATADALFGQLPILAPRRIQKRIIAVFLTTALLLAKAIHFKCVFCVAPSASIACSFQRICSRTLHLPHVLLFPRKSQSSDGMPRQWN